MTRTPDRAVAVFDLDGTLTRGDTFVPFLRRARGTARTARAALTHPVLLARAPFSGDGRHRAKEAILVELFEGEPLEELDEAAESFAEEVVARRLRHRVLEQVEVHRRAGHELVLVSASPDVYVQPIGRRLNFDAVLATRLEASPDGRLTGRIAGFNCRGREKVTRLRAWLGERPALVYAYGDSTGDRELLHSADTAFRLRRGRLTRDS